MKSTKSIIAMFVLLFLIALLDAGIVKGQTTAPFKVRNDVPSDLKSQAHTSNDDWVSLGFPAMSIYSLSLDSLHRMYVCTDSGVYRSLDRGRTWYQYLLAGRRVGLFFGDSYGRFFAVTDTSYFGTMMKRIVRSTDGGASWRTTFFYSGLSLKFFALATLPPDNIYLAVGPAQSLLGGVYLSTDGGLGWDKNFSGYTFTSGATALVPTRNSYLLASVTGDPPKLAKLFAVGKPQILGDFYVTAIGECLGVFYAGVTGVIYRSSDEGATWTPSKTGLPNETIRDIVVSPYGQVFALAYDKVYVSIDRGTSWNPYTRGLPVTPMIALKMDDQDYLAVATAAAGIFRTIAPIGDDAPSSGIVGDGVPSSFELKQNYPNPFNPSTTIGYSLPKTENVSLRVFNTLGQEVASLVNEQKAAGYYQSTWNANVPSGIYYYRLQAADFIETKKAILLK